MVLHEPLILHRPSAVRCGETILRVLCVSVADSVAMESVVASHNSRRGLEWCGVKRDRPSQ